MSSEYLVWQIQVFLLGTFKVLFFFLHTFHSRLVEGHGVTPMDTEGQRHITPSPSEERVVNLRDITEEILKGFVQG